MRKWFLSGNILYFLFFLGFLLFTSPNPTIFHKFAPNYFKGIIALVFLAIPYNFLLLILAYDKAKISFGKKKIHINLLYRTLIVCVLLIALAFFAELFLRVRPKPLVENFHPFLQAINTKKNDADHQINSDNFRYKEISRKKPEGVYRIFITGGSTVYDEWQPYDGNVVRRVEIILQKQFPDKKLEVINAGYNRYTSEHSLILYATKLTDYNPDLIIIWQGFNDLYYSCSPPYLTSGQYKSDYSHFYAVLANMVNNHFNVYPKSELLALLYKAFSEKFYADIKYKLPQPVKKNTAVPVDWKFPSIDAYKRNMDYLIRLVKSDNRYIIIGNQANMYTGDEKGNYGLAQGLCKTNNRYPNIKSLTDGLTTTNDITKKLAEEYQIPFVDLEKAVPKTSNYFTDDVHYTSLGDQKVAEAVAATIIQSGYVE